MKHFLIYIGLLGQLLFCSAAFSAKSEGFPGRKEFPDIPYLELAQLRQNFDQYVIVDARSEYEYKTLRIKGALNISVARDDFAAQVQALRKTTRKPIVFYCNGRSCFKSYRAAKIASGKGVSDVYSYDAGVFEWAVEHPDMAVLLGESPMDPSHIISKSRFKTHLLPIPEFIGKVHDSGRKALVIDIRDMYQRAGITLFPGVERWAHLDNQKKLNRYIQKAVKEDRVLFVYDEVGKQVRWLQYSLERAGVKTYFFMKGGARGYFKMLDTVAIN